MKRIVLCALSLLFAVLALAQSRLVTESIQSKVLGAEVKYNVYLPAGYSPAQEYPVIYLLHRPYGVYSDWQEKGRMKDVADELIASGELVPVVIVMPNAGHEDVHHVQNGYFNVQD